MSRMTSSPLHQVALCEAPVTWTQALLSSWSSNRRDTEWPARAFTIMPSTALQLLFLHLQSSASIPSLHHGVLIPSLKVRKLKRVSLWGRKREEEMWHSHPGSQGSVHSGHPTNSCREELEGWCHHMGRIRRVLLQVLQAQKLGCNSHWEGPMGRSGRGRI